MFGGWGIRPPSGSSGGRTPVGHDLLGVELGRGDARPSPPRRAAAAARRSAEVAQLEGDAQRAPARSRTASAIAVRLSRPSASRRLKPSLSAKATTSSRPRSSTQRASHRHAPSRPFSPRTASSTAGHTSVTALKRARRRRPRSAPAVGCGLRRARGLGFRLDGARRPGAARRGSARSGPGAGGSGAVWAARRGGAASAPGRPARLQALEARHQRPRGGVDLRRGGPDERELQARAGVGPALTGASRGEQVQQAHDVGPGRAGLLGQAASRSGVRPARRDVAECLHDEQVAHVGLEVAEELGDARRCRRARAGPPGGAGVAVATASTRRRAGRRRRRRGPRARPRWRPVPL